MKNVNISQFIGLIFIDITVNKDEDEIIFIDINSNCYKMFHKQECCEDVKIEDICGNINDLINHPILLAEEVINEGEKGFDTFTWTFYKLSTIIGNLTIRWYGTSNGYYSENVDIIKY